MKKKIALITGAWNGEAAYEIFRGIQKRADIENADIYLFCCYGGGSIYDPLYDEGEYNIFNLPNLEDFDGVIMLTNDLGNDDLIPELHKRLLESGVPCISLEQELEGVAYLGTDSYAAIYELTEHLIKVHGCKTINYVGGPKSHMENILRRTGYEDALKANGMVVDQRRIREFYYMQSDGRRAFFEFQEEGLECPDAVICANDSMAIGYITTAIEQGYRVPEDVRVTGFDNMERAREFSPRITSIDREREGMGYRAMLLLFKMIAGEKIKHKQFLPYRIECSESCGCRTGEHKGTEQFRLRSFDEKEKILSHGIWIDRFQRDILRKQSREGFAQTLDVHLSVFNMNGFCLCLNYEESEDSLIAASNISRKGFADYMEVFYVYRVENRPKHGQLQNLFAEENKKKAVRMKTSDLIPECLKDTEKNHFYSFLPIHYNGRHFGYCVFLDQADYLRQFKMLHWISSINLAMEEIRKNMVLSRANEKLNELYIRDSMTGLYNRFGLRQKGEPLYSRNLCNGKGTTVMFVDMDGLKTINDTYGHEMGDLAIKSIANCVKMAVKGLEAEVIRYGGDEFLVLASCQKERIAKRMKEDIEDMLVRYNHYSRLPFEVAASIGYVITDSDGVYGLMNYIEWADDAMYEEKKKHHRERS